MQSSRQKGMVLVMALIMLLVITIIGVSAVRMSGLDTQVAGNSIYSSLVFQGAESALGRASRDDFSITKALLEKDKIFKVPASYFTPYEKITAGITLDSSATMLYQGDMDSPPLNDIANDSEFQYMVIQVTGTSRLDVTSARADHLEGIAKQKAP